MMQIISKQVLPLRYFLGIIKYKSFAIIHLQHTSRVTQATVLHFGTSGVRSLPLAAGINVGGHYKWHFFLLSSRLIANSMHYAILCNFWVEKGGILKSCPKLRYDFVGVGGGV
jgi:hypothetical protein